jgi:hypothetical protein
MKRKKPDASEAEFARIAKALSKYPRVDVLVSSGKGKYFDPGHGRLMKEWLAVDHRNKALCYVLREKRWSSRPPAPRDPRAEAGPTTVGHPPQSVHLLDEKKLFFFWASETCCG